MTIREQWVVGGKSNGRGEGKGSVYKGADVEVRHTSNAFDWKHLICGRPFLANPGAPPRRSVLSNAARTSLDKLHYDTVHAMHAWLDDTKLYASHYIFDVVRVLQLNYIKLATSR